jgi:hypothetical protein
MPLAFSSLTSRVSRRRLYRLFFIFLILALNLDGQTKTRSESRTID